MVAISFRVTFTLHHGLHDLAWPTFLISPPTIFPLLTLFHPHWPSCSSSNAPRVVPPQSLCSGCSLCLDFSSLTYPHGSLFHPLQVIAQMAPSPCCLPCSPHLKLHLPHLLFYIPLTSFIFRNFPSSDLLYFTYIPSLLSRMSASAGQRTVTILFTAVPQCLAHS